MYKRYIFFNICTRKDKYEDKNDQFVSKLLSIIINIWYPKREILKSN